MVVARQEEATKRAARAQLRRAIRDELANRSDSFSRRPRNAALLRRVRSLSRRAAT
ncbi:MAG: hypothetical protein R2736_24040 [Solirubrobacterales bacterium]